MRNLSHTASSRICMDRRSRLQFRASVLDSWHIEFFLLSLSLSLFKSTGDEADNAGSHRFLAPSSIPSANLLPQTPQKKNTWSVPPPGRPAQGTRCRPQESHSRSLVSVSSDGRASTKINDNRDFRLLLFLHSVALSCNAPQRFLARQLQLTNGCQNSFYFFFFSVVSDNFCLR